MPRDDASRSVDKRQKVAPAVEKMIRRYTLEGFYARNSRARCYKSIILLTKVYAALAVRDEMKS